MSLGSLRMSGPMTRVRSPNVPTLNSHSGSAASALRLARANSCAAGSQAPL